ncbi:hypothetical protein [Clostridium sp.]|nr:hypothetical protein [Clostridium sp.]MDU1840935.1 hypothetical protein [Clostridium sp.]
MKVDRLAIEAISPITCTLTTTATSVPSKVPVTLKICGVFNWFSS